MIKIIETDTYIKSLKKFDKQIRIKIEKKVNLLKNNPKLGKPLKYTNLWQLYIGNNHRVLYAIKHEQVDILVAILLAIPKKDLDGNYPRITKELVKMYKELLLFILLRIYPV